MRSREEKQHKKGQETNIGKIIYGFLLFMPLIAIGSAILVNTFNMASKQQTKITYKYETNEVNTATEYIIDNAYHMKVEDKYWYNILQEGSDRYQLAFYNIQKYDFTSFGILTNEVTNTINSNSTNLFLVLSVSSNRDDYDSYFTLYSDLNEDPLYDIYIGPLDAHKFTLEGDFILQYAPSISFNPIYVNNELKYNPIESVETDNVNAQDVFYDSVDKIAESPLFTWAENSIIYTTTANTCTALSITTPFIPLLFSYWLIISVMYFLYDIALMLVWLIHNKIHSLQESL